eukprot:gnl/MRDRNA2_/MRDRNA2_36051_c0_seq1.p1 gnl/MRDRNA2_/MRDRNA2_36051_c0~~gnl/MRDRNA2_/MRDRNA2_36051_c0_seq1.p1  ORF type:complete len:390 (-),score=70.57 gnl/MRDRNA2_/MRDRNA2_36051_c0_seq1:23-1192(-)
MRATTKRQAPPRTLLRSRSPRRSKHQNGKIGVADPASDSPDETDNRGNSVVFKKMDIINSEREKTKAPKKFAWMDSDDEAVDSDEEKDHKAPSQERAVEWTNNGSEKGASTSISISSAKDVSSFGAMMILVDDLKDNGTLTSSPPSEIADVCCALARFKLYDGEFLEKVLVPALRSMLSKGLTLGTPMIDPDLLPSSANQTAMAQTAPQESTKFTVKEVIEMTIALASLNAAEVLGDIFAMTATTLTPYGKSIGKANRRLLIEAYEKNGHEDEIEWLKYCPLPAGENGEAPPVQGSKVAGLNSVGLHMKPGFAICKEFAKMGTCHRGSECLLDHPEEAKLRFNEDNLPFRPWEKSCSYYLTTGSCDYKRTCKWHHPNLTSQYRRGQPQR